MKAESQAIYMADFILADMIILEIDKESIGVKNEGKSAN